MNQNRLPQLACTILVPVHRIIEFDRLSHIIKSLKSYELKAAFWVPSNAIFVCDEFGWVKRYELAEEVEFEQ